MNSEKGSMCWLKGLIKSQCSWIQAPNCLLGTPQNPPRGSMFVLHRNLLLLPVTSPWICNRQNIQTFQSYTLYCDVMVKSRTNWIAQFCAHPCPGKITNSKGRKCGIICWKKSEFCWEGVVKKSMAEKSMEDTCLLLPFTVLVRAVIWAYEVQRVGDWATPQAHIWVCCHKWMIHTSQVLKWLEETYILSTPENGEGKKNGCFSCGNKSVGTWWWRRWWWIE